MWRNGSSNYCSGMLVNSIPQGFKCHASRHVPVEKVMFYVKGAPGYPSCSTGEPL